MRCLGRYLHMSYPRSFETQIKLAYFSILAPFSILNKVVFRTVRSSLFLSTLTLNLTKEESILSFPSEIKLLEVTTWVSQLKQIIEELGGLQLITYLRLCIRVSWFIIPLKEFKCSIISWSSMYSNFTNHMGRWSLWQGGLCSLASSFDSRIQVLSRGYMYWTYW